MNNLDKEQTEAALDSSGHLLIVAPPGSGKTRVLAARFCRLAREAGPDGVLAVTFTNRAAREMAERVESMMEERGKPARGFNITTFHAFCLRLLRQRRPGFSLYGRVEQEGLLKELGVKGPAKAADRITCLKNAGAGGGGPDDEERELVELYNDGLRRAGALDLDDLVLESIKALEGDGPGGAGLFPYVLVDEYQDINPPQARLVRLLAGPDGRVSAIGDPGQSIYAFRGSDPRCFADFVRDYPGAQRVELTRCYRSGARIVEAAAAVAAVMGAGRGGPARVFRPTRPGGAVTLVNSPDGKAEAGYIVREIERLMGGLSSLTVGASGGGEARDLRFSDFAVLARTNAMAESMAVEFARSSVPFQLVGPALQSMAGFIKRLKRAVIGDCAEVRGFVEGEAETAGLSPEARSVVLDAASSETGVGPEGLASFIEALEVAGPEDRFDITADSVSIMTMHMTKGLEFDTVFITGAEDGVIPLRLAASNRFDPEEERRLFYVAMTRARQNLYVTTARRRMVWGEAREGVPSPFIEDIPAALLKTVDLETKPRRRRQVQEGLFD